MARILDLSDHERYRIWSEHRRKYLHQTCSRFAHGLHKVTGWPIVGIDWKDGRLGHAGLRSPDGSCWDVRGPSVDREFREPFSDPAYYAQAIREVELAEVLDMIGPGAEFLHCAEDHISQIWPCLPHLPTSRRSRAMKFAAEIEQISQRTEVWISSCGLGSHLWPMLAEGDGTELDYRLRRAGKALEFDRTLSYEEGAAVTSVPKRVQAFLTELNVLSREHRLWVRSSMPTTWPRLDVRPDERREVVLVPVEGAGGYLIDSRCAR
jgi:hypothetical protein